MFFIFCGCKSRNIVYIIAFCFRKVCINRWFYNLYIEHFFESKKILNLGKREVVFNFQIKIANVMWFVT